MKLYKILNTHLIAHYLYNRQEVVFEIGFEQKKNFLKFFHLTFI